jgi:hypothetical protein
LRSHRKRPASCWVDGAAMNNLATLIASALAVAFTATLASAGVVARVVLVAETDSVVTTAPALEATPAVTIGTEANAAELEWLDQSVELFIVNGLDLPALEVFFFDDEVECGGHHGTYRRNTTPAQIRICSDKPFVLPHELAHAWEAENVSDEMRETYVTDRELSTWSDHGYEWNERGVEDAAFVVQQNLTKKNVRTTSSTWQGRMAAYELLTGQPSPLRTSDRK